MDVIPWSVLLPILLRVLLLVALVIFVPAWVFRRTSRDLSYGLGLVMSFLTILLPYLSYENNALLISSLYQTFYGWPVSGLFEMKWISWSLTAGAIMACWYCAWLIYTVRGRILNSILLFLWLGFILNISAQVILPIAVFGQFGLNLAIDDQVFLSLCLAITLSSTFYLCVSKKAHDLYRFARLDR